MLYLEKKSTVHKKYNFTHAKEHLPNTQPTNKKSSYLLFVCLEVVMSPSVYIVALKKAVLFALHNIFKFFMDVFDGP